MFGKRNLLNILMNKFLTFSFLFLLTFGVFASTDRVFEFEKEAYPFDDNIKEDLFYSLLNELRCPKCQSSNLAGSNSPISNDLKREVYELVKEKKTSEQIKEHLVERYGNFIIYNPPVESETYILWFGPFFLVFIAIFSIIFFRRRHAL